MNAGRSQQSLHHGSYGMHLERGKKLERSGYTTLNWLGHGVAGISELAFVCIRHETFVMWAAATAAKAAAAEKPAPRPPFLPAVGWPSALTGQGPGLPRLAAPLLRSLPWVREMTHDRTRNGGLCFCQLTLDWYLWKVEYCLWSGERLFLSTHNLHSLLLNKSPVWMALICLPGDFLKIYSSLEPHHSKYHSVKKKKWEGV